MRVSEGLSVLFLSPQKLLPPPSPPVRPPPLQLSHLKSRIPFGELASKVSRVLLLKANSAMNLRIGVVTSGTSAQA